MTLKVALPKQKYTFHLQKYRIFHFKLTSKIRILFFTILTISDIEFNYLLMNIF